MGKDFLLLFTLFFAFVWHQSLALRFSRSHAWFNRNKHDSTFNGHSYDQMGTTSGLSLSRTALWMASVGPAPAAPPPPQRAFLIAPDVETGAVEQQILNNFSQIQAGVQQRIGIIGTSELDFNQQTMIELLAYALVLSGNHVFTSGGGNGTNLAVIRGALRACNPDMLTVILPQSRWKQPLELQSILNRVNNVIESPENDGLDLKEAANLCNYKILAEVEKILVFVYHDSLTILGPLEEFEGAMDIIRFYLD